jgi:hypothetical protein
MRPPHRLEPLQRATQSTVIDGPGHLERSVRQQVAFGQPPAELGALVRKVRDHAYKITDADIDALRAKYSEDQLFEVMIAAAIGAAGHRLQRALTALEGA